MAMNWYVVHIQTGKEQHVKTSLEGRIRAKKMSSLITKVLVPTETVSEIRGGKKTISERKFFPGYVLVRMELNDETWKMVKGTQGVSKFIGQGYKPIALSDDEVGQIERQIAEKKEKPKPKVVFSKGESVKVIEGPFTNFSGSIEEVNQNKQKLKVMVSIFGRSTPVDLEYWQVEKV